MNGCIMLNKIRCSMYCFYCTDYSKIDEDEMEKYINKKLGELSIHMFLQQLR